MATNNPTTEPPVDPTISRLDLAVARSLDTARARAETRVKRFLDAGFELVNSPGGTDITVQDVVDRSGQSLRSFYQYFAGKYEFLLALFEELVRFTAEQLQEQVAEEDQAVDRLHRFVVEYHRLCRPGTKSRTPRRVPTSAMAEFGQQLLTTHPKEASKAFAPLMSLLVELVDDAMAQGVVRTDVPSRRMAGVMLQSTMFNAFATTISGSAAKSADDASEEFWHLMFEGIGSF
jgi:AcrR family transcriptional regulator